MYHCQRLMEEVDEVVGDNETVDADDLENLKYMQQVYTGHYASHTVCSPISCCISYLSHFHICTMIVSIIFTHFFLVLVALE